MWITGDKCKWEEEVSEKLEEDEGRRAHMATSLLLMCFFLQRGPP